MNLSKFPIYIICMYIWAIFTTHNNQSFKLEGEDGSMEYLPMIDMSKSNFLGKFKIVVLG